MPIIWLGILKMSFDPVDLFLKTTCYFWENYVK